MDWLNDKLNDSQREAVMSTEGYNRIIAGAGTGKTRVLVYKYAYIVTELGIDPKNILAITFTNKAANEMKKRAKKLLGKEVLENAMFFTFHGFCVRVLREDGVNIGWNKNFSILDDADKKEMLKNILEEENYYDKYPNIRIDNVLKYIECQELSKPNTIIEGLIYDKFYVDEDNKMYDYIYKKFLLKQKQQYVLDYNDLLVLTLKLFKINNDVLVKWQKLLQYILVDEYQDTSNSQNNLLHLLQEYNKNLTVVGDPDQNIYAWRGARMDFILNFDKTYEPTKDVLVMLNYRSTPQILANANSLINHNENRIKKDLISFKKDGDKVIHYYAENGNDEANYIANEIKKLIDKGILLKNIAILYRASFLSRNIEQSLIQNNIKYKIYSGIKFFQREEIKDIIAYLKLINGDKIDDTSLIRIINKPTRKIGPKKIREIKECSKSTGKTYYEIIKNNYKFKNEQVENLLKVIEKYRNIKEYNSLTEFIKSYLDETGYIEFRKQLNEEERLENIAEMMNTIKNYEEDNRYEEITLNNFLQEISLYTSADELNDDDYVSLMTIHTSKGLEYDYVFTLGWNDGILPSIKTLEERKKAGLEEERRLAYVAITRAKKKLFISNSGSSPNRINIPSRFLIELSENNLERINCSIDSLWDEMKLSFEDYQMIEIEKNEIDKISIGDYVNHSIFGAGVIVDITDSSFMIEFKKDKGKLKPVLKTFKGLSLINEVEYENDEK